MADIERIRKLADRLDERRASGARLVPAAATIAVQALRVYADVLERSLRDEDLSQPFLVEVVDKDHHCEKVLAKCSHVTVARAAFADRRQLDQAFDNLPEAPVGAQTVAADGVQWENVAA